MAPKGITLECLIIISLNSNKCLYIDIRLTSEFPQDKALDQTSSQLITLPIRICNIYKREKRHLWKKETVTRGKGRKKTLETMMVGVMTRAKMMKKVTLMRLCSNISQLRSNKKMSNKKLQL